MALTFSTVRQARWHHRRDQFAMEPPRLSRIASPAGDRAGSFTGKLKPEDWQKQGYDHAERIGELGYVLETQASTVADGDLAIVEVDDQGNLIESDQDNDSSPLRQASERVLNALRGVDGDYHAFLEVGTWHDQIAGEAILIGEEIPDNGGLAFSLLSVLEVVHSSDTRAGGTKAIIRKRSATKTTSLSVADPVASETELGPETYMTRYVRRSKAYSGDPTSVLKRNGSVCREIVLLDQLKETMIESRLSAGILFVPEEVTFPTDDETINDVTEADRFLEILMEHISAPVRDRSNPAALGPLIVRVPADFIEKFRLFSLTDNHLDLAAVEEAREKALARLAAGLDLPKERMQGMGGTSHWNAAGIEADEIRRHIIPLGQRLARFFTEYYLRRMLVEFEGVDEDDAARVSFEYDASTLLARADKATAANDLWADGLMSNDARVAANGFDPDEVRPSDTERALRFLEKLAVVPHTNNRVLLDALIKWDAVDISPELREAFLSIPATTGDKPAANEPAPATEPAPPPQGLPQPAVGEPGVDRETLAVLERIRTIASLAVNRTLEKAATNVVSASRRLPPDKRTLIERAPRAGNRKCEVLHVMGPADWKAIGRTPDKFVDGAFTEVERLISVWLTDLLVSWDYNGRDAQIRARRAAAHLVDQLGALTIQGFTRSLTHDPAATGLVVPLQMVVDTVGAATA